jgi:7-carboxy-7-deazaguanine synthase
VQGEGIRTGVPTAFVRLAGCNLDCIWCDTRFSHTEIGTRKMEAEEILQEVSDLRMGSVCITGGEPFCHEGIDDLVAILLSKGLDVDVETNGSFDIVRFLKRCPGAFISMDVKTPSSGMEDSFRIDNLTYLRPSDQLKFILSDRIDWEFSLDFLRKYNPSCNIVFTPCHNKGGADIASLIKAELVGSSLNGDIRLHRILSRSRLMVQTHKVIWGDARGV